MIDLKKRSTIERKAFWLLIALSFLVFFAQTRNFKLLQDGLTYSAISRNILETGEWKKLHYDTKYYPDFYQHPPLAMWMQALIYKVLGYSEPVSRILSSTCSLLSVAIVFIFSNKFFSLSAAVWSSFVLISSTRFVKWGSNFYLDSIFGFFSFLSLCFWLVSISKSKKSENNFLFHSFLSGLFLAAAFMTKGVIAFSPLSVILFSIFVFPSVNILYSFLIFVIGLATPLFLWGLYGDGFEFIRNYILTSVEGRTQIHHFSIHPWITIYGTWLPWWPLLLISIGTFFREIQKKGWTMGSGIFLVLFIFAVSYPLGFSFGTNYFEHYLTPFYPAASILVGAQLGRIPYLKTITDQGVQTGFLFLIIAALYVATIAPSFHVVQDKAPIHWLNEIERIPENERKQIKKIAFSNRAVDTWYGLANISAKSSFQAIASFDLSQEATSDTILITSREENPHSSWKQIPCFYVDGFRAFVSKTTQICERQ